MKTQKTDIANDPQLRENLRTQWYATLYLQVLLAIFLGILLGVFYPDTAKLMKPLGDAFIGLIKMMIAPVIFCTIVHGIGMMSDMKAVGRVGLKALLYFEIVSSFALFIGLAVGEIFKPGAGFHIDPATLNASSVTSYVTRAHEDGVVAHLLDIIPKTFLGAFTSGDLLQVLVVSILTGIAVSRLGETGTKIAGAIEKIGKVFFGVIALIARLAPIGAFGAMAFTIGAYGLDALKPLLGLVAAFYASSLLFIIIVLGLVARAAGFSIFKYLAYIKDELLIVLGTSSSETALPQLIEKMHHLGAPRSVVGLVVPTGYSFNLDGTNIYMTLAILFLAQATGTPLSYGEMATILVIAMITSKGASGVTGAGFVTLAATLAVVPQIPIASLALLLGIDKFMSECRALTNIIGNGVATLVVSRWEGNLDEQKLRVIK